MARELERQLSELYISNLDIIGEGFSAAVNSARRGYIEDFMLMSIPATDDPRYRHTDLRGIFAGEWEHYFTPQDGGRDAAAAIPAEGYRIDMINGFHRGGTPLTVLDNGIVYGSLRQAMAERWDLVSKYYNRAADNGTQAVTALNSAFMQDGAFVYIPEGVEAAMPFILSFDYASQEQAQMCFPRVLIAADRGARADIVISHGNSNGTRFLVDAVHEIFAGHGSAIGISEISQLGAGGRLIVNAFVKQEEGSRMQIADIWLTEGETRATTTIDLEGAGCESDLYALYMSGREERTDINLNVNHLHPYCSSSQLVKGVVSGRAVGAFTGNVLVARQAQRTVAMQQSRNLQLSDTSRIFTEPRLEIYADDVKCSHGATVGQIDDEAIYYMRQRGIDEPQALRLQLAGFVNDIVSHCTVVALCEHIGEVVEKRIDEL